MKMDAFCRPAKRTKITHHQDSYYDFDRASSSAAALSEKFSDEVPPPPDANFWLDSSVYALEPAQQLASASSRNGNVNGWLLPNDNYFQEDPGIQNWLSEQLPFLFQVELPSVEQRHVNLGIVNPFDEGRNVKRFKDSDREKRVVPKDGAVNSYIKFRIRQTDGALPTDQPKSPFRRLSVSSQSSQTSNSSNSSLPPTLIPYLPPDFGRKWKLDETDNKLLRFYLVAFCNGRTLLPKSNSYLEIASIAEQDAGVKHALMSVAAGYVLDYVPTPQLQARANYHFRKAVEYLNDALHDVQTHAVGKGDAAVASLVLLFTDDTIQWEFYKSPKGITAEPRWLTGAKVARTLLDNTDPGYRYWDPINVQSTNARYSNANMIAYFNIIAEPVTPLNPSSSDRMYQWLLEGTSREVRKIHGTSSLSPKLLHTYAQITHLCARLSESPDSSVLPHGAKRIEQRLKIFRQWSDLSEGHASIEELFDSCVLDADGRVSTAAEVTDLTGQTYIQTALLYLYCRFFRMPRTHPKVLKALELARGCLDRMPYNGPLFTAQSPFFPIILMCLVSYRPEDRKSLYNWFTAVTADAGARSSVPPVWRAMQDMWKWMNHEIIDEFYDEKRPIGQRYAWWEVMVTRLMETEGVLCLA